MNGFEMILDPLPEAQIEHLIHRRFHQRGDGEQASDR